jgi:signal transduction histidine kinase/ligand-binding sensor domain-containing protein
MWFCSSEGLVRYDGYAFQIFGPESGLPSRAIWNMIASKTGGYWIVSDRGLCRIAANAKIGEPCRLLGSDVPFRVGGGSILETTSGKVFFAAPNGLYRVSPDGRKLQSLGFQPRPIEQIIALAEGEAGALLVCTDRDIFEWRAPGQVRNLTQNLRIVGIYQWLFTPSEDILLATGEGLFRFRYHPGRQEPMLDSNLLGERFQVFHMLQRHDGSLWISGFNFSRQRKEVSRLEFAANGSIRSRESFTEAEGLSGADFMVEDARGNLWGAVGGIGVFKLDESGIRYYDSRDGLGSARIASIFEDRKGHLSVITSWTGGPNFHVRTGDRFEPVAIPVTPGFVTYGWGWNQFGLQARDGEWWIPTSGGLFHYAAADELRSAKLKEILNDKSPLGCSDVYRVFEDSASNIWIACAGIKATLNVWERATGKIRRWTTAEGWPDDYGTNVIREPHPGVFWIGSNMAMVRMRNGRFEVFELLPGHAIPDIRDVHFDRAGRLWIATVRTGLFRCDNPDADRPQFTAYTMADGLASDSIRSLTSDADGFLYVGTVRGVDRIDPRAPREARRVRHLTPADGLPDSEHNVAFTDHEGHLWFGTLRGLAEVDGPALRRAAPPDVRLTRVRVRGEDVPIGWDGTEHASIDLAPDRNQIEVEFAGGPRDQSSLRYQYRLTGAADEWSPPSTRLAVNYPALPSGTLRFEVRAVNADDQASPNVASIDLFVQAPLWRRWWFLLLSAAAIAAAVYGSYRYRLRQILALERIRTRIATDLHDDIGANLTQIALLSEVAGRGSGNGSLGEISTIARETVEQMSDIVWAVSPRHDRFDALLHRMRRFAEDTLESAGVDLSFESEGVDHEFTAPLELRRPLYLVFKEAIHNIAKHSGAHKAMVRISRDRSSIRLTISDDGRGFDFSAQRHGEGIDSITRRIKSVGGTAAWGTSPGSGTRLDISVPLAPVTQAAGPARKRRM